MLRNSAHSFISRTFYHILISTSCILPTRSFVLRTFFMWRKVRKSRIKINKFDCLSLHSTKEGRICNAKLLLQELAREKSVFVGLSPVSSLLCLLLWWKMSEDHEPTTMIMMLFPVVAVLVGLVLDVANRSDLWSFSRLIFDLSQAQQSLQDPWLCAAVSDLAAGRVITVVLGGLQYPTVTWTIQ